LILRQKPNQPQDRGLQSGLNLCNANHHDRPAAVHPPSSHQISAITTKTSERFH
jgi:hypothetical protein